MELQLKVVLISFPIQKETSEVAWLAIGLRRSTNGIVVFNGDGTFEDYSPGNMNVSVIQKTNFKLQTDAGRERCHTN